MRKLLFILMISLSTTVLAKVSFERVKNVFSYVQNTSGFHVILKYDPDTEVNAYNDYNVIYVTQGMLDFMNTDDDIAMILGHEIAHHGNQDYRTENSSVQELRADKDGYYYCKKMGKKNCLKIFRKMYTEFGDEGDDGVHPAWSVRLNKLKNK